jgi:hypothetical protein
MRSLLSIRNLLRLALVAAAPILAFALIRAADRPGIQVVADEAHRRVDITIDGKPFTSYVWPDTLKKPVLFPLVDDEGVTVTRGYPLEPQPGERIDHPHHAGLWFNYGNANGFDFWNNSDAIKPEDRAKMGTILHTKIVSVRSGAERGELMVDSVWMTGADKALIEETTKYVFARQGHTRTVDLIATLKPLERVVFNDDKEGLLGIRVARWLESPEEKGGQFMDANGRPTPVSSASAEATGVYLTSEGVRGPAAWGTRGRWCLLSGHNGDGHTDTIAIVDHPQNPGYPTYWHARGYGLFAANPLGRSIFDPKQPPFNFTAEKGSTVTFRYRVLISSQALTSQDLNREADAFAAEYR